MFKKLAPSSKDVGIRMMGSKGRVFVATRISLQWSVEEVCVSFRPSSGLQIHSPKVIFLDRANGIDCSHVGLDTKNFKAQTGSLLYHLVCVIGVLWRHSIRLPFDVAWNVLFSSQR